METSVQELLQATKKFKGQRAMIQMVAPHVLHISASYEDRSGYGEFQIQWHDVVLDFPAPRLEVFDDGWAFLAAIAPLLMPLLAEADNKAIAPAELMGKLKAIGFEEAASD
jgi:hypothetical protein